MRFSSNPPSLVIREAQMEAFRQSALRRFEDSMLHHLRRHFPAKCEAAGERALREDIRYGKLVAASL
jgi:hypothetical protein